jgi:anti-sigma-K factor RskA
MTENDDLDGLAAEYVLGSLSLAERKDVDARRMRDAALDQAVVAWERRLGPLSAGAPGIEPPPDLFASIADRLWGADRPSGATVIPMPARRRTGGWRAYAVGASAMAACLLLGVAWLLLNVNVPARTMQFVGELHRSAGTAADEGAGAKGAPAFKIALDLNTRNMVVEPVSLRATPRRSFELWLLRTGGAAPVSLGLVSHSARTTVPWREDYPTSGLVDDSLAVSLEPEGGSPARAPTGPILFVGKLRAATP